MAEDTNTRYESPIVRDGPGAERLARMLKALGNPVRFQIMQTLAERRSCITQEIVDTTPLAQSTVSQHLKVLREAGLIQGEIEGPATCYCIDPAGVRWLKEQIDGWLPGCCEPTEALRVGVPGSLRALHPATGGMQMTDDHYCERSNP